jgi:hypothetical protein
VTAHALRRRVSQRQQVRTGLVGGRADRLIEDAQATLLDALLESAPGLGADPVVHSRVGRFHFLLLTSCLPPQMFPSRTAAPPEFGSACHMSQRYARKSRRGAIPGPTTLMLTA